MSLARGEIPRPPALPVDKPPSLIPSGAIGAGIEAEYLREAANYLRYMRAEPPRAAMSSTPLAWLELVYSHLARKEVDRAIDILFHNVDGMLARREFAVCNDLLRAIDLKRLDTNLVVAALTITLPAAADLPFRKRFVERAEKMLNEVAPERSARMLARLR